MANRIDLELERSFKKIELIHRFKDDMEFFSKTDTTPTKFDIISQRFKFLNFIRKK